MSNSNGVIVNPVNTTDIKNVLGVNDNRQSYLCGNAHGKINKWSFRKPVRHPKLFGILTDAELYLVDDGFIIPSYSNPVTLFNDKNVNNATWGYWPPAGGQSTPYRRSDFHYYDHNATVPFAFSIDNPEAGVGGSLRINCDRSISSIVNFNSFAAWRGANLDNLGFGFLISQKTSSNIMNCFYYNSTGGTTLPEVEEKLNISINKNYFTAESTYTIIPVLTSLFVRNLGTFTPVNDTTGNIWFMFPSDVMEFTVSNAPQYNPIDYFSLEILSGSFLTGSDGIGDYYYNILFNAKIAMSSGFTNSGQVSVEFIFERAYIGGTGTHELSIGGMSSTLSGGGSYTKSISYPSMIHIVAGELEKLTLRADIRITVGGTTHIGSQYVTIWN